jgi:hypothetical protein
MCNCCSETKKRDDSDLGIPECENVMLRRIVDNPFNRRWYAHLIGRTFTSAKCPSYAAWEIVEEKSGQIFNVKDLRSMEVCSDLIGRASERKLFS